MTCPNCGAPDSQVVPVWEDMDRFEDDEHPKFIGCKSCHQMMRSDLLRDDDDETPPQASLSQHDRNWLASRGMVGNQHSSQLTIIEWQCVKGAAMYYGVRDWKSKSDSTLTKEENVSLMEQYGSRNSETTMRMTKTPHKHD